MRRIIFADFTPSANKERITALFSFLEQIDNEDAMLNSLLHSNGYEERRVTHCMEVLLANLQSTLDTSFL
ncbi:hypothetical protein TNCV_5010881 [Trichonephila clavipes]|nr:hypothetical protein TNCV_5010881 [Trichonephila clavipes]